MTCRPLVQDGVPVGVICGPERTERIVDHRYGNRKRWCFGCRKPRMFRYVVTREVGWSWYDPNPSVRCGTCGLVDGDMFPGGYREWDY